MAVEKGTNSGFVTTAPTGDPSGSPISVVIGGTSIARVTHDTSQSTAGKIIEVGWWCDGATTEADWKIALYAADGNVVPDEAGTRLFITNAVAKGTNAGWKSTSVDWNIDSSTEYWIGIWLASGTSTNSNYTDSGGTGADSKAGELNDPFGGGALDNANRMITLYALTEEAPAGFTRKIKIAGTFVDKPIKEKKAGTFQDKTIKIKVGGAFQDA